mmetsp:Transcript_92000/g.295898  ORF Transcript_92000/g.295898 Transcript_92000/m.295898 type:complete len:256 (+) Transcript_92000:884-1651(+)
MVCVVVAPEVRHALGRGDACMALDVLENEVLPPTLASVATGRARGSKATREHGRVAAEGGVGLDADAGVKRAHSTEDPAAAAAALVVDFADHIRALRPTLAGVEGRRQHVPGRRTKVLVGGALGYLARALEGRPAKPRVQGVLGLVEHPVPHLDGEAALPSVPRLGQGLGHGRLRALDGFLQGLDVISDPPFVRTLRVDHGRDKAVLECAQLRICELGVDARLTDDMLEGVVGGLRQQAGAADARKLGLGRQLVY